MHAVWNVNRFTWVFCALVIAAASGDAAPLQAKPVKAGSEAIAVRGISRAPALGPTSASAAEIVRVLPYSQLSQTRLRVLRDQGPEFKHWLSRMELDWRAPGYAKNLTFRWDTAVPHAAAAVWQVSVHRYPLDMSHWRTPSGLVAEGRLTTAPKPGTNADFQIDFNTFAPKPGVLKELTPKLISAVTKAVGGSSDSSPSLLGPALKPGPTLSNTDRRVRNFKPKPPRAMHVQYYVRIVPIDANGDALGLPSGSVEISYGDPAPQPYVDMSYAQNTNNGYWDPAVPADVPTLRHPQVTIGCYEPIRKDQPQKIYHYIVTSNVPPFFGALKPGTALDFTPHKDDKNWLESIGEFFKDVVSFASEAVNWVATAYADIKAFSISWAPAEIRGVLSAGLDIGLAALGLPPSIPSFDELTSMGADYLIRTAADYSGIDPDLAAMAVQKFVEATASQASTGGNPAVWLRPDPAYYYRPAYVRLEITNTTNAPTDQVLAGINIEPVGDKDAVQHGETVFNTACACIPSLKPGESVSVPVFLSECMPLRWDDHGLEDGMHRFWIRYNTYPMKIVVSTFNSGPYRNRYQVQQTLQLDHAYYRYSAQ